MDPLPYEIIESMIQVFGRSFHLKDKMQSFLISSGVSKGLVAKYKNEYKFVWARYVLNELEETEDGRIIQRRILTNLCTLRNLPDPTVPDRNAGLDALRDLKQLAVKHQLMINEEKQNAITRKTIKYQEQQIKIERAQKLEELRNIFAKNLTSQNRQGAGYALEQLLKDLFALYEIEYRPSYKTDTQQIDGHFRFDGFDYLVEARWRKNIPDEDEIGGFQRKVNTKLESTRGLFVSIQGYRKNVIDQFCGQGANIIFMCGRDLILILEGHIDLRDALRAKIDRAAQEGITYYPLDVLL